MHLPILRNARLATLAALGLLAVTLLSVAVSAVGVRGLALVDQHLRVAAEETFPASETVSRMIEAQATISRGLNAILLPRMPRELRASSAKRSAAAFERLAEAERAFEALPHHPDTGARWAETRRALDAWCASAAEVIARVREGEAELARGETTGPAYDRAWQAWMAARDLYPAAEKGLADLQAAVAADVKEERAEGAAEAKAARRLLVGSAVACIALALAVSFLLARRIARAIGAVAGEARRLTDAARAGDLGVRGDPAAVTPELRELVAGMNATMEAVAGPLAVTAERLGQVSRGELPPPIEDRFAGAFAELAAAVNRSTAAVRAVVVQIDAVTGAARRGDLAARADARGAEGAWARVLDGVNGALDALAAPVAEASRVLHRLADNDLTARMAGRYEGDHARLAHDLNASAAALHDAVSQVARGVAEVNSAAGEIAASSGAVATGAADQASSLEETSASLETMAALTASTSNGAARAEALARDARSAADQGAASVAQMASAMERIRAAAEGTAQIIREVNEIAFQTNLLALNAAVEAARAGDAGRGFAVVAEEVRALALRSKGAAERTEALIRESVSEAGAGEATSRSVEARLQEIVRAVSDVSGLVGEIAAGAREQASGIGQLEEAVARVGSVTQRNAASAEQSSAAAAELSAQSRELADLVARFRVAGAPAAHALPAPEAWDAPAARA